MDTHRRVVNFKMDSSVLLLHFDGSNDTQIYEVPGPWWVNDNFFIDSSRYAHPIWRISRFEPPGGGKNPTIVPNGKFMGMMEAQSGWTRWAHHEAFNFLNDDFTVDFWFKLSSSPIYDSGFGLTLNYAAGPLPFSNYLVVGTTVSPQEPPYEAMNVRAQFKDAQENTIILIGSTNLATLPSGQWRHIAFVKSGMNHRLYLDGQLENQWDCATSFYTYPPTEPITYLSKHHELYVNTSDLNKVRIDEVRIIRRAMWTDNFTPPTEAYRG